MAKSLPARAPVRGPRNESKSGTTPVDEGARFLTDARNSRPGPSSRRLAHPISRITWEGSLDYDSREAIHHGVASEGRSMIGTRCHCLDDVIEEPIDITAVRTWAPFRAVLGSLGCPDRLPELLSTDCLCWEDEGDLPSHLPTEAPGLTLSVIGAATAPDINHLLHAYEHVDGPVFLLRLSETPFGRELTAWICVDQRDAAQIAAQQAVTWGWIGLDFSLTVAGTPDEEEVIQASTAQRAAA
jgi:hypothetical protein